ncbi:7790_t:CDS:2 [Ambispora gerdemannii]|uniref:Ras modification protein ERF4 n=1 Tax=Ambispora gerdemannii TaxID=144530 RepID=A0A9N8UZL4_9GLOM|nr:7790_t:CDS:2 [Ambispora gerdemannii]
MDNSVGHLQKENIGTENEIQITADKRNFSTVFPLSVGSDDVAVDKREFGSFEERPQAVEREARSNTNKGNISIAVAKGDTSYSNTAEEAEGNSKSSVPKAKGKQETDNDSAATITTTNTTKTYNFLNFSSSYKPTPNMTINAETRSHQSSQPASPNSPNTPYPYSEDPEIDLKHVSDIAEEGMTTSRLAEMDPSVQRLPTQDTRSSSRSTSAQIPTPKQIIRIERDYSRGELCQFYAAFPLEIDGRVSPRVFQQTITTLNELLEKAHSPKYNWVDNFLACLTLYMSTLCKRPHYDRMVEEICKFLDNENKTTYNHQGLNFRNPQKTAFLFVSFL